MSPVRDLLEGRSGGAAGDRLLPEVPTMTRKVGCAGGRVGLRPMRLGPVVMTKFIQSRVLAAAVTRRD